MPNRKFFVLFEPLFLKENPFLSRRHLFFSLNFDKIAQQNNKVYVILESKKFIFIVFENKAINF